MEKIERLPKWAQDHIHSLARERDTALKALNEAVDRQTPTPFFYEDMLCLGEQVGPSLKRFYIQAHRVSLLAPNGVQLDIMLRAEIIELSWSDEDRSHRGDIGFVPSSHQQGRLVRT